jgi:sulfur-oxidizing protein SoxZ
MTGSIKMRVDLQGDRVNVRAFIQHPMDTGREKDSKTGKIIPAHFIQEVIGSLNDKTVWSAHWGTGIAKNPFVSFSVRGGKPGDRVRIHWIDNLGESDQMEIALQTAAVDRSKS